MPNNVGKEPNNELCPLKSSPSCNHDYCSSMVVYRSLKLNNLVEDHKLRLSNQLLVNTTGVPPPKSDYTCSTRSCFLDSFLSSFPQLLSSVLCRLYRMPPKNVGKESKNEANTHNPVTDITIHWQTLHYDFICDNTQHAS